MADSISATIVLAETPGGESYGFNISACKAGVDVTLGVIKFAVIFLGASLPNNAMFLRIFKPGARTLLNVPSREEGFLKLLVWPYGGAKGISNSNPTKVCAITRKLCKKPVA